jgi:GDPmannose 4,6-dehydratase
VLEAIRQLSPRKSVKFFQACSSEMYGNCEQCPQNEQTPFHPTSPYACAKVYAFHQTVNYRETYELFACNGILFNHESPRRGENFVTRKVSRAVTRIREGLQQVLKLGNVRAQRDWGYAPDYVDAMWRMLQRDSPRDYVVATGEVHTVEALARLAFASVQLDYDQYVRIDPRLLRPAEGTLRRGDATRAHEELGWQPTTTFTQLIAIMVAADWELARQERALRGVVAGSEET